MFDFDTWWRSFALELKSIWMAGRYRKWQGQMVYTNRLDFG